MELDQKSLVDDWDGEDYWERLAWENYSGPKRNLGNFSNPGCTSASTDYVAAVSKPHSCVPVALAEYGKQGTLQRHGLVLDSMNNRDCELVVG